MQLVKNWQALAWAIDCEGCVCCIRRKKKNWFTVLVQIGMCDREFPEAMKEIFGVGKINYHCRPDKKHRDFWYWRVQKQSDVEYILRNCLPFFLVKGDKAKLALDILKYKKSLKKHRHDSETGRFISTSPEAIKQFNEFHEQIQKLTKSIR